jgi:hypothetical protein
MLRLGKKEAGGRPAVAERVWGPRKTKGRMFSQSTSSRTLFGEAKSTSEFSRRCVQASNRITWDCLILLYYSAMLLLYLSLQFLPSSFDLYHYLILPYSFHKIHPE